MKKIAAVCLALAGLAAVPLHASVSAAEMELPEKTRSRLETALEPRSSADTFAEFESGTENFTESMSGTETFTKPEDIAESSTDPEGGAETSAESENSTEDSTEPESDTEASTEPESDTEDSTEPESDTEASTEPESDTEASTEPEGSTNPPSESESSAGTSPATEAQEPGNSKGEHNPMPVTKPEFSTTDTIITHYRMYHGRPQYRRWNETRKRWKDPRWLYDCRCIKNLMLHPGKALTLNVNMINPRYTSQAVYWKSRNPRVVRAYKNGRILAKKRGNTRIVAVHRKTRRTVAKIRIIVRGKG